MRRDAGARWAIHYIYGCNRGSHPNDWMPHAAPLTSASRSLSADELAERRAAVYRLLEAVEVVDVGRPVLRRASEPFSTPLGTLDAIHLSTAFSWRDARTSELTMATHDKPLGTAARAMGLRVTGV